MTYLRIVPFREVRLLDFTGGVLVADLPTKQRIHDRPANVAFSSAATQPVKSISSSNLSRSASIRVEQMECIFHHAFYRNLCVVFDLRVSLEHYRENRQNSDDKMTLYGVRILAELRLDQVVEAQLVRLVQHDGGQLGQ